MTLELFDVHGSTPDLEDAFKAAAKVGADALLTLTPLLINHQKRITELALKNRCQLGSKAAPGWRLAGSYPILPTSRRCFAVPRPKSTRSSEVPILPKSPSGNQARGKRALSPGLV